MKGYQGKEGSLRFLKSLNLLVPEWSIITHESILQNADVKLYQELEKTILNHMTNEILPKAQAFIESLKIDTSFVKSGSQYAVRSSASLEDSPENSFAGFMNSVA